MVTSKRNEDNDLSYSPVRCQTQERARQTSQSRNEKSQNKTFQVKRLRESVKLKQIFKNEKSDLQKLTFNS